MGHHRRIGRLRDACHRDASSPRAPRDDPRPPARPLLTFPTPSPALGLAAFYKKYIDADGIPIVSSNHVEDAALLAAREILRHMLSKRPDARAHIIDAKVRVAVMADEEQTLDIPEHSDLASMPTDTPGVDWNARARGLGATLGRPVTSCGEENLLCWKNDRYAGENVLIHEFGHTVAQIGLEDDETFQRDLRTAFFDATARGLWSETYAGTNVDEYWAEGVQDWFDTNIQGGPFHNATHTRAQLATYDPPLYRLLGQVFEDDGWRYSCESARTLE